jgi:mono/diheme cytochrome c family protein
MRFLLGLVVGVLLIPASVWLYFRFGYAPVAKAAAIPATEENYLQGAEVYREHCAVCHGLPDRPATPTSKGMFPKPPQLFEHGVTDDPVGETYWKVENGIRLTGMPAYTKSLSETQIWQVSMMLANADKLPASVLAKLRQPMEGH